MHRYVSKPSRYDFAPNGHVVLRGPVSLFAQERSPQQAVPLAYVQERSLKVALPLGHVREGSSYARRSSGGTDSKNNPLNAAVLYCTNSINRGSADYQYVNNTTFRRNTKTVMSYVVTAVG